MARIYEFHVRVARQYLTSLHSERVRYCHLRLSSFGMINMPFILLKEVLSRASYEVGFFTDHNTQTVH